MNIKKIRFFTLLCLLSVSPAFVSFCGNEPVTESAKTVDTDNDGLTDAEEAAIGSSPVLADTDGDGRSDSEEVSLFDPTGNVFQYNPLIADVPTVDLEIVTVPNVTLDYTTTLGNSQSFSTTRSNTTATAINTSQNGSTSLAIEESHTVGGSLSVTGGYAKNDGPSVSVTVEGHYDYTNSTTTETSTGWSRDQMTENSTTTDQGQAYETANSISTSGGQMSVTVNIVNNGLQAFTLTNATISANMISPYNNTVVRPIDNLVISNVGGFPSTSLVPGQTISNLVYSTGMLNIDTAKALLTNSSGVSLELSAYEMLDKDGVPFAFTTADVLGRTATVILDMGAQKPIKVMVATKGDSATQRITLSKVLTNVLKMNYTLDANNQLNSISTGVNTYTQNLLSNDTYWVISTNSTDGINRSMVSYSSAATPAYNFNDLTLKAGDVVHISFIEDYDFDGLGTRMEALAGTDPWNPDSDSDGLYDGFEVLVVHTSPLNSDSNGNLIIDPLEVITDISMKGSTGYMINGAGNLLVWSSNLYGAALQTEAGVTSGAQAKAQVSRPTIYGTAQDWARVFSTDFFTGFAIKGDGTLWGWGYNGVNTILDRNLMAYDMQPTPMQIGVDTDWKEVMGNPQVMLGIKTDGKLWQWGRRFDNLIYTNHQVLPNAAYPDAVIVDAAVSSNTDFFFSLVAYAVDQSGALYYWGTDASGQLPVTSPLTDPVQYTGLTGVKEVAAGWNHVLALKSNGDLYVSGDNSCGATGKGKMTADPVGTGFVKIGTGFKTISAAGISSAAVKMDGTLWIWGSQDLAEFIGTGSCSPAFVLTTPKRVGVENNWGRVEVGVYTTIAIRNDGTAEIVGGQGPGQGFIDYPTLLGQGTYPVTPLYYTSTFLPLTPY